MTTAASSNSEVTLRGKFRKGNVIPYAAATAVLAVAFIGGLAVGSGGNTIISGILGASSSSSNFIDSFGALLGVGFAFVAGMAMTVNPCGFVMLPTYLGLYIGTEDARENEGALKRLGRATTISIAVGLGFLVLFGGVGTAISAGARSIVDVFPWVGLAIGVLLTAFAGYIFAGGKLYTAFATNTANKIGDPRDSSLRGYFLFGISYATASLSCTLPIFLALISSSLATGGFFEAASQFVVFALGMTFVIGLLTVAVALAKRRVQQALKRILPHTNTISATLLLLAGGYIVFYWLTEGGLADSIL